MNESLARSATARTFVVLFVLVAAAGAQTYSVLASLNSDSESATPLVDNSGNVFGTTRDGGSGGCGVVFELVNNGGGSYTNTTLYNFTCAADGANPFGGVVMDSAGNLYGTAQYGGANDIGTVYELENDGGGSYTFELLYTFSNGKGGHYPQGDLVMFKGSLYGVTHEGGVNGCNTAEHHGCGTVYRLTESGGKWTETVLHLFEGGVPGDGKFPYAGVTLDSKGNIYGTTYGGGSTRNGIVFRLNSGSYKETILHSFDGTDGCQIESGVVPDSAGNLYGTATACGPDDVGTVYQLKRSGSGFKMILTKWNLPTEATGHLAVDSAGNVYGIAYEGGANQVGAIFKLAVGSFRPTELYEFTRKEPDGYLPRGGVSLDAHGNLYGTTIQGGNGGASTVWQIEKP